MEPMRLNPSVRARHLRLEPGNPLPDTRREADPLPRQYLGIAEAVARAAAQGPGVLPPGIAHAVLRLAFGSGAALPVDRDMTNASGVSTAPRLVRTPRPLRRREEREPRSTLRLKCTSE